MRATLRFVISVLCSLAQLAASFATNSVLLGSALWPTREVSTFSSLPKSDLNEMALVVMRPSISGKVTFMAMSLEINPLGLLAHVSLLEPERIAWKTGLSDWSKIVPCHSVPGFEMAKLVVLMMVAGFASSKIWVMISFATWSFKLLAKMGRGLRPCSCKSLMSWSIGSRSPDCSKAR